MAASYHDIITDPSHANLSIDAQKKMGLPACGDMSKEHKDWITDIIAMSDRGEIDVLRPETLVRPEVYSTLSAEDRAQVDSNLYTLANELRHIEGFYRDDATPNACQQLERMIDHFWAARDRLEEHGDVFKF